MSWSPRGARAEEAGRPMRRPPGGQAAGDAPPAWGAGGEGRIRRVLQVNGRAVGPQRRRQSERTGVKNDCRVFFVTGVCGLRAPSLQPCLILCDPVDRSPPGSSVHGILQARTLGWATMPSRGSSRPRDGTHLSCLSGVGGGHIFTHGVTWEPDRFTTVC